MLRLTEDDGHEHEASSLPFLSGPPIVDDESDGVVRGHYGKSFPNDGRCIWCGALPTNPGGWKPT